MQIIIAFAVGLGLIVLVNMTRVAQYEEPPLVPPATGTALVAPDANVVDRTAQEVTDAAAGNPDEDDAGN